MRWPERLGVLAVAVAVALLAPALALAAQPDASPTAALQAAIQGRDVSPKDAPFGARGDGVTDDTKAIAAAVAWCREHGARLWWPAGTYVTTASIPDFHGVAHAGPGAIKRGGTLFFVAPTGATAANNDLYVAPGGSDANDGLGPAQAMAAPGHAAGVLYNYGPSLSGHWVVHLAAGTYSSPRHAIDLRNLKSANSIVFAGPEVGGSPNVPSAVIDGSAAGAGQGIGAFFAGGMRVQLQDIKFTHWGHAGSEGAIHAEEGTYLYLRNVHVDTAHYYGVRMFGGFLYVEGGVYRNIAHYGVMVQDAQYAVGYNGAADRNRVSIRDSATGFYAVGSADGHLQFTDIGGTGVGRSVWLNDGARSQFDGNSASGASVADVYTDGGSSFFENTPSRWGSAVPYLQRGASTRENDAQHQSLPYRAFLAAQVDKSRSDTPAAIVSLPDLQPGTYFVEAEGDGTAGAGGARLGIGGTAVVSYLRATGQLWNGTVLLDSHQDVATSGVPATTSCAMAGAFTHFRITGSVTIATAGTLTLRFAQGKADPAASSIFRGAILRATRLD